MARPREFDTDKVLETIACTFWERGYLATSLEDLVQATGVAKASLYAAFGDKHELYLAALKHYIDQSCAPYRELFEQAKSPKAALRECNR